MSDLLLARLDELLLAQMGQTIRPVEELEEVGELHIVYRSGFALAADSRVGSAVRVEFGPDGDAGLDHGGDPATDYEVGSEAGYLCIQVLRLDFVDLNVRPYAYYDAGNCLPVRA
jgi:hypothetical protein